MKKISNICGFIGIAIYAVLLIRISNLCQYGGTKVDLIPILILGVVLIATFILELLAVEKKKKLKTVNCSGEMYCSCCHDHFVWRQDYLFGNPL